MTKKIMDVNAVPSYLSTSFHTNMVLVKKADRVVTITPLDDELGEKTFNCPFLGIAADSELTVDKFLEWKREERAVEYEGDLRT